ncbi:type II secretion system protein GspG [Stigmatella hybrida]|uniref:type II secretion system protein GspG n=1 Tax=Stigmatella hybrida TaxID=394097 RepID=UPI001CDB2D5E|nr:type II secretion system protein GspG [Stigmatella hybrida]
MSAPPPPHPKLNAKALLRDLLLWTLTCLGIVLGSGLLTAGCQLLSAHRQEAGRKPDVARLDLAAIHRALRAYHAEHQRFPSTEEGLRPLVDNQHLEQLPRDPWGNPYGYELRGERPVVWSRGADGLPGGEGPDADLFDAQQK